METREQLEVKLEGWILDAFLVAAYKTYTAKEIELIREVVLDWFFSNKWEKFVFDDIGTAIKKGSFREFGEYAQISAVEVVTWCKKWRAAKFKETPIVHYVAPVEKQLPSASQKLIDDSDIATARKEFEEKGSYYDHGNILFNKLFRRGLLPTVDGKLRDSVQKKAIQMLREEKVRKAKADAIASKMGEKKLKDQIERLMAAYFENEASQLAHQVVKMWLTDSLPNDLESNP